jgi:hypothetical protein
VSPKDPCHSATVSFTCTAGAAVGAGAAFFAAALRGDFFSMVSIFISAPL